jgi:uncharacterized membrane protein YdjX (TVP38/TMEM64 family)
VACGIGKGTAGVVFFWGHKSFEGWVSRRFRYRMRSFTESNNWVTVLFRNKGVPRLIFLLTQGVPFFPMRSGLVVYTFTSTTSRMEIFIIMTVGGMLRNILMYSAIYYGLVPFHSLLTE